MPQLSRLVYRANDRHKFDWLGDNTTYAQRGQKVSVFYTGKLASNGKVFDSNVGRAYALPIVLAVVMISATDACS